MSDMGKSRTSLHGYGQAGANADLMDDDPSMSVNPYRAPPDDEIFHFKDKEKIQKIMQRDGWDSGENEWRKNVIKKKKYNFWNSETEY